MTVPTDLGDLSTTAASNSPAGSDAIGTSLDDYLRAIQAIIRQTASKGVDIASSGTITIPDAGNLFDVTGTTTITAINDAWDGRVAILRFDGALTLTHSASLVLPGASNITTETGDIVAMINETTGVWRCAFYQPNDGYVERISSTDNGLIKFDGTSGNIQGTGIGVTDANDIFGAVGIRGPVASTGTLTLYGGTFNTGAGIVLYGASHATLPNVIQFTNGAFSEKMRLNASGQLGVGLSPSYQLQLSTDSAAKPSTNTWTIASDQRLKENIIPADLQVCYDIVKNLPLKKYTWKVSAYDSEQVKDRSKLGWIAQDVQPVFPKSVELHSFGGVENDTAQTEEYEVQDTEAVQIEVEKIEIIEDANGRKSPVLKTVIEERQEPVFDEVEVKDEQGNVVLRDGRPLKAEIPRMTKKTKPKKDKLQIDDCLSLNTDQIYAAMYGTIQLLIKKVEDLEARL